MIGNWRKPPKDLSAGSVSFTGPALFRHEYLRVYSDYYHDLHPLLQKVFQKRQGILLDKLEFRSDPFLPSNPGIETLISAALIKMTLGLKRYVPTYFREVYVTSNSYTYSRDKRLFKGDVNPGTGRITLSWPAVKEGFRIADDAQNVALHEVSHALDLETTMMDRHGYFFKTNRWRQWEKVGARRLYALAKRPMSAQTKHIGMKELFANTVEAFFEKPHELAAAAPGIYQAIARLLHQDPREDVWPLIP